MSAYTVSQLAHNAGVSVHIVRDYLVRGLLRPVACTTGGYGVFDDAALQRLCFVRAAFEAGIGLDALARLCRALDAADGAQAAAQLAVTVSYTHLRAHETAEKKKKNKHGKHK
ncbi:mercury resistance co-regulator MerD [Salmonella enterica]|uniref:mercury resistance co-regulator MerD n=1 Tax=Salmonella enterica TaxID=28901 RepID=UPI0022B8476B|nr:mercury resistance co-regulator MerD [Salmonella enterica]